MGLTFRVTDYADFTMIHVEPDDPVLTPADIKVALHKLPEVDFAKGVVISGRCPIWFYAALTHAFHPAAWVATYDPRLKGGVVVMSHTPQRSVGDVVEIEG